MVQGSVDKYEIDSSTKSIKLKILELDEADMLLQADVLQYREKTHLTCKPTIHLLPVILFVSFAHLLLLFVASITIDRANSVQKTPPIEAQLYYVESSPLPERVKKVVSRESESVSQPVETPVKPTSNNDVKTEQQIRQQAPPLERTKPASTSLAEKTLRDLASRLVEQAKNDAASATYQDFVNRKSQVGRSTTPYYEGLAVGELKLKTKQVNCDNTLKKSVAVLSGLMGGHDKV